MEYLAILLVALAQFTAFSWGRGRETYYLPEEEKIEDKLADKYGQCPIPTICGYRCGGGDLPEAVVTNVRCTNKYAGPYVPEFTAFYISPRTWRFDFSYNSIVYVNEGSFYTDQYESVPVNLTFLNMSHNSISSISPKAFQGHVSKQLATLDLSYNRLTSLEDGVFDDMPALATLKLSYNSLVSIDGICQATLRSINLLDLEYNYLSTIIDGCLSKTPLTSRGSLILRKNRIGFINDCRFSSLQRVEIGENPTICKCSNEFAGESCFEADGGSQSTQEICRDTTKCSSLPQFNVTYERSGNLNFKVKMNTILTGYTVKIYNFANLDNNKTVTVTTKPQNASLSTREDYILCVTKGSSSQATVCQYLNPPTYRAINSANNRPIISTAIFLITMCLLAFASVL